MQGIRSFYETDYIYDGTYRELIPEDVENEQSDDYLFGTVPETYKEIDTPIKFNYSDKGTNVLVKQFPSWGLNSGSLVIELELTDDIALKIDDIIIIDGVENRVEQFSIQYENDFNSLVQHSPYRSNVRRLATIKIG